MAATTEDHQRLVAQAPQHLPGETQVRGFLVDHIGFANPNDGRLQELAEMGVDEGLWAESIRLAREALIMHDEAHATILYRIYQINDTLRGRLDDNYFGQDGLLFWFMSLYTMSRRWIDLHPDIAPVATRAFFSRFDAFRPEDADDLQWTLVIREWLQCIMQSWTSGLRNLRIPELQRLMEDLCWFTTGADPDHPDILYQPEEILIGVRAMITRMRTTLWYTNALIAICSSAETTEINIQIPIGTLAEFQQRYLANVETGYGANPSGETRLVLRLPLPAFRSVIEVYLGEIQAWDALVRGETQPLEPPPRPWLPATEVLTDTEMADANDLGCMICRLWVNNGTDTLVRLSCRCAATFHGGDQGCVATWFRRLQRAVPICPLCRQVVQRRYLDTQ